MSAFKSRDTVVNKLPEHDFTKNVIVDNRYVVSKEIDGEYYFYDKHTDQMVLSDNVITLNEFKNLGILDDFISLCEQ